MTKCDVSIIMGSDSDLPVMQASATILKEFSIPFEILIISAHRTPEKMVVFAKTARQRGVKVIIAGAGGAAHLPGMTASLTTLPVIGVPIHTKTLEGLDSLYSIVQMPTGIPVATVAINGAANAALLAVKMLATSDEKLTKKLETYTKNLEEMVLDKNDELQKLGIEKYLSKK